MASIPAHTETLAPSCLKPSPRLPPQGILTPGFCCDAMSLSLRVFTAFLVARQLGQPPSLPPCGTAIPPRPSRRSHKGRGGFTTQSKRHAGFAPGPARPQRGTAQHTLPADAAWWGRGSPCQCASRQPSPPASDRQTCRSRRPRPPRTPSGEGVEIIECVGLLGVQLTYALHPHQNRNEIPPASR